MANDDELTAGGAIDASVACPYLGLVDDADSHATYATEAHRCYRLPNPTKIAGGHQDSFCLSDNHVTCPVYLGEAVGQARQASRGAAAAAARPRPVAPARTRPTRDQGLNPRPRTGGIPMPQLTIGILVLAAVVLGLAIWLQALGGGDDDEASPSDQVQTQTAQRTQQARTAQASPSSPGTQAAGTQTQTGTPAPGGSATATRPAGSPTTVGGSATYTVVSGDTCSGIAEKTNITLEQLFQLNGLDNDKCTKLNVGQVLKLR